MESKKEAMLLGEQGHSVHPPHGGAQNDDFASEERRRKKEKKARLEEKVTPGGRGCQAATRC